MVEQQTFNLLVVGSSPTRLTIGLSAFDVMPWLKRLRSTFEVWLTQVGLLLVPRLPRPLLVRLARLLGAAGAYVARRERRVAEANLELAFGASLSAAERRRILRRSFQTFALVLLDVLWFTRDSRARLTRHVHFDPELAQRLFVSKAHLCVTAHLGNWEILGQAVSLHGHPLHSVAAPLKNPRVEALFTPLRLLTGQVVLHKKGVLRPLLGILRSGKKVGILLDQNTRPSEGGLFVPFFGRHVCVASAPAALALHTKCEILFGYCLPSADGDYRVVFGGALPPQDKEAEGVDEETLTARILSIIEEAVRSHPEHWLWMYKRWKWVPPGIDSEAFPFYAAPLGPDQRDHARLFPSA